MNWIISLSHRRCTCAQWSPSWESVL
uniref:Uncharacterized protein n=1 Tax=Lepeophtheirus salmonis TaxID=72036 RepID=A0A0K2URP3_LEPSM